MRLSQKQKVKLIGCIYKEVTDLKLALCKASGDFKYHADKEIDDKITFLDDNIWRRIKKEFKIK